MDTVTLQFWQLLERAELDQDTCLIIDETGNPKKPIILLTTILWAIG
ncbi:MAG: hypothetical protein ACXVMS_18535 [Flavisolibacter sp.]